MCAVETRTRIGTDRLVLRAPQGGDALMLADFGNDLGVAGMTASMPHPFGVDEAEACLAKVTAGDPRKRAGFVIEHRQFGAGIKGPGRIRIREKRARPECDPCNILRTAGTPYRTAGHIHDFSHPLIAGRIVPVTSPKPTR